MEFNKEYYSKPFEELPSETAEDILYILEREVPFRLSVLQSIERELKFPTKR